MSHEPGPVDPRRPEIERLERERAERSDEPTGRIGLPRKVSNAGL